MRASELVTEAYSDRLEQAAQFISKRYGDLAVERQDLIAALERFAVTQPIGSVKPREFALDVIRHMGDKVKIKRKAPAASERNKAFAELNALIPTLAHQLMTELGIVFPDGDPHDVSSTLIRQFQNRLRNIQLDLGNYGSLGDWFYANVWPKVLKEFKKQNGQDVYDYLADMWDEQRAQNHYDYEHGHAQLDPTYQGTNPYRSSR